MGSSGKVIWPYDELASELAQASRCTRLKEEKQSCVQRLTYSKFPAEGVLVGVVRAHDRGDGDRKNVERDCSQVVRCKGQAHMGLSETLSRTN